MESLSTILENVTKDVLSDVNQKDIKEAFEGEIKTRVDEQVKLQLEEMDKTYAEKLKDAFEKIDENHAQSIEELVESIDEDHSQKLETLVSEMDKTYTEKLKQVKEHYENNLVTEMEAFKNKLLDSIELYLDEKIDAAIPAEVFHNAAKNYLSKNTEVSESETILSNLTKKFDKDKATFIESKFLGKDANFIKRNFNTVCEMWDKKQKSQKETLAEKAKINNITSRKEPNMLSENESEVSDHKESVGESTNPLMNACLAVLGNA